MLFAWPAIAAFLVLGQPSGQTYAADLPISAPGDATSVNPPVEPLTPAPATATAPPPTATTAPVASQNTPDVAAEHTVVPPHLRLPPAFADFAADYHPEELHPEWLTVQIGTLETVFAPPAGKAMFVLPTLQSELADAFQPVEISCLLGAKSRFENITQIDVDPLGHPLGYSLPLGKVAYVLARAELPQGISFSFYYYESAKLRWVPNPEKAGSFMPVTEAIAEAQNLTVPADGYVFIYLSNRVGPPHPDSTARPVTLYTYVVLHVHPVPQPAPALDAPASATSSP
jgi:hypothetical protein